MEMTGRYIGESTVTGCVNGKRYRIIGDYKGSFYVVIDESGEDYAYSKKVFADLQPVPGGQAELTVAG